MSRRRALAEAGTIMDAFGPLDSPIAVSDRPPEPPPGSVTPPTPEAALGVLEQTASQPSQDEWGPLPSSRKIAEIPTVAALAALMACAYPEWQNPLGNGASVLGDSASLEGYTVEGHAIVRLGIKRPTCHDWYKIIVPKTLRFEEL